MPTAASRSSAHARSTWRASVRRLPTASRIVNRPSSRVCDRKTSPVRLTASMIAALAASSAGSVQLAAGRVPAEADRRERDGRQPLPVRVGVDPAGELGGHREVLLDPPAQTLEPEPAQLDPQLEGAEPPAELRLVVVEVPDGSFAVERAQVLRHETERRVAVTPSGGSAGATRRAA